MAQFRIPGPLRRLSDGQVTVPVEAADLASAIDALDARYPGFRDRLLDEKGELRQFVNVYLNDEDVRLGAGLREKVGSDDEIAIVPAVAGGTGAISPSVRQRGFRHLNNPGFCTVATPGINSRQWGDAG